MVKCWASSLGGCSKKQSKEHYISKSIFRSGQVTLTDFQWLEGETKTLSVESVTSKILCERHNNQLSLLDSEAVKAFQAFDEIIRVQQVRDALKPSAVNRIVRYSINGWLFERWVAKTIVGLFCVVGRGEKWQLTQTSSCDPPQNLVAAIYGETSFNSPMGLYAAIAVGETYELLDGISIKPYFHPDGGLVGSVLIFKGFHFFIWLTQEAVSSFLSDKEKVFGPAGEPLIYRLAQIRFNTHGKLSQVLEIDWP